jgi:hypothetical protein
MPKKFIQRWLPSPEFIRKQRSLQFLGSWLHDPNLFHLNRRSAAGAFAVGLFVCYLPIPFQMITAAFLATVTRVNMPLSVVLVFTTNPFTMPPMFYFAYQVGSLFVGQPADGFYFELSWSWLWLSLREIGPTFLIGCLICGSMLSLTGYLFIRLLWRQTVLRNWQKSRQRANRS